MNSKKSSFLQQFANLISLLPKGRYTVFRMGWQLLGAPEKFIGKLDKSPFVVDFADRYTSVHQFLYGYYEPEVTLVFLSLISSGSQIMDIGANKGYFSLLAAKRVGNSGKIFSYEPSPSNIEDMNETQVLSEYKHWQIIPVAVSSSVGTTSFCDDGIEEGHSGWGKVDSSGKLSVQSSTVDFEIERLGLKHLDIVKMDIEGHETQAIKGMSNSLANHKIRNFLIELHLAVISESELSEIINQFDSFGYKGQIINEMAHNSVQRCLNSLESMIIGKKIDVSDMLIPLNDYKQQFANKNRIHVLYSK